MPELKPDHRAVLKQRQFVKQITDLPLQLELLSVGELQRIALTAQSCDPHHLHIAIENWLAASNRHVFNPTELLLVHQFH